ncbi:ethylene-responsive transcription factor ERF039 [Physcomitrium patens]|uniref:AP2/ERF domain-containing protein n=1 Tax=Physcomitrium patens TaxID=3218 RepID=A0A2K1JBR2_PHYPA|nr:ethylene-responsive transcription factor ERF039-like [Physcomitrium patens]XP_024397268.1 ethylene-responsive transcription factor ERF039-like [Physcomitrium patens]PNR38976.1 hypothetical protein PHYPA_019254 [Physcomitrium patens]|eukprot:XP_024397267.1 ethylene-responsive transcription factor ERF039-like [Physcomitrella patens]
MSNNAGSSYRGVRMRRWGKWVSEIREPQRSGSRTNRIWLGSFRSAEEAAHAYDAALLCLRGSTANLNFPNFNYRLPAGTPGRYTTREIQAAAAAAAAQSAGRPFSYNNFMSPDSSSDSEDEVEDITYNESTSNTNDGTPSQPAYNDGWRSFDDNPYNQVDEMARGLMIRPPNNDSDDSDDDNDDEDPPLW